MAALCVREQRIAAIDDDVTLVEEGEQRLDLGIDGCTGLDHHQHDAWAGDRCNEFCQVIGADELVAAFARHGELAGSGRGPVEHRDAVSVVDEVQDEVPAHNGEADDPDVCSVLDDCL
jgi:hypothetical protein